MLELKNIKRCTKLIRKYNFNVYIPQKYKNRINQINSECICSIQNNYNFHCYLRVRSDEFVSY